jgi:transcriptional regulator
MYSTGKGLPGKARGEQSANAKLTNTDIGIVWTMRQQGATLKTIAEILHVSIANVSDILHYKTWKHISLSLNDHQLLTS